MLTLESYQKVAEAAIQAVNNNGVSFYSWVNAPVVEDNGIITHTTGWGDSAETRDVSGEEVLDIMTGKLNGAYGERLITSLGTVAALIMNGYFVRLVQFRREEGIPFEADGCTSIIIETMPVFHCEPHDLCLEGIEDLVEVLDSNKTEDVCWKETNKPSEFAALMAGVCQPGLDLVKIAQAASKAVAQ